jgi:hypothetical protein
MTKPKGTFHCNRCEITFKAEYNKTPRPRKSCPNCHKSCDIVKEKKVKEKIIEKSRSFNPPQNNDNIIDDPNELLMSCAMRELNKSTPDVRWGNILLTLLDKTKQLETKSKKEVMIRRKLVKYSSNQLIELRKKLIKS